MRRPLRAPTAIPPDDREWASLFEEGIRSYLEATTAIVTFEQGVQKKCTEVLERHVDDYSAALQPPEELDGNDIQPYQWPTREKFDGANLSVGATIQGKRFEPFVKWWGTYCTLEWTEQKCYAGIGEWIGGPWTKSEHLFQTLRKLGVEEYDDDIGSGLYHVEKGVGICKDIPAEKAGGIETVLDNLLQEWIAHWKKIGGMKKLFK